MRMVPRCAVLSLLIVVVSCGQVEPVLVTVSMPDCTFRGETEMQPGEVSLSLSLNGLGSSKAVLVELVDGHSYDELADYLELGGGWDGRPNWARTVIDLELSDTDGVEGTADSSDLGVGDYAVVCLDIETGTVQTASQLQVRESVINDSRGGERGRRP